MYARLYANLQASFCARPRPEGHSSLHFGVLFRYKTYFVLKKVNGEELWAIENAHRGGVTALAVSTNRKFLVSGGYEGEVRVWEIRTREMVVNLKQHTAAVTGLKLFSDDSHVYSSSRDRTILLWDLRAETRQVTMTQRMGGINAIEMMPGSTELVSVGQEKRLVMWDNRESAPLGATDAPDGSPPMGEQHAVALTMGEGQPKLALIATAGAADCRVRLWRYDGLQLLAVGDGHSSTVRGLRFSPDGKQLVSVADDGAVLVWNIFLEECFPGYFDAPPPA